MGMMTMGSVSIFQLDFSGTRFAAARDFTGGYTLRAGEHVLPMTPDVADALAQGGWLIRSRAQVAVRTGRELKAGRTFARNLLSVDGRSVHIELDVADDGGGIYVEIAGTRLTLTDQQAGVLLALLDQLGRDVNAVSRASEPPGMDLTVAQSMRGWLWDWERDPTW